MPISTQRQENATVVQQPKKSNQGAPQKGKTLYNKQSKRKSYPFQQCSRKSYLCLCLCVGSGLEGESCLRSSDCVEGLCCARHFWSKICKPVLKEGQVCTKHKRKGTHALEIFQRCDCGDGLSCRMQKGDHSKASRSLHTCQRH